MTITMDEDRQDETRAAALLSVLARVYDAAGWYSGSGLVRCPMCREGAIAYHVRLVGVHRITRATCSTVGCVQVGP